MPDTPSHDPSTRNTRFEAVVEQFLRECEAGRSPDPQRYLDNFPELTSLLRDFFAGQDLFDRLAPDLAPQAQTGPVATSLALPPPGEHVGDFELLEELGRGGMGVVYRARQTKLDRVVALKMIRGGQDEAELARFRVEAEAIARLQHPNIVQLFEVGEHNGMPFFALEYCAGGSLEERLRGTALLPAEAAAVIAALARAMHAAHQHNVIHRDLKPANVLLAGGDASTPLDQLTPKVTDFGLARKLDDPGLTQTGVIMGTPSYMAPEQASGRSKEVDPAADIYALGAVLYECLTGRPPFRAATTLDTLAQVLNTDPVPPRQLNPAVPRDLETVSLKCLHKDPRRRYADAAALAEDLSRYLDGRPVQARRVGRTERLLKWVRRRPAAAALALVVMLLVVGAGAAGWWYQQDQLEQAEQRKQLAIEEGKRQVAEAAQRAREATRKDYVTKEVTPALQKVEDGLKELQQALGRLLPDPKHPLSVSVLLSDLKQWHDRVQTAKAFYQQAKKLTDSYPEALEPQQKARLDQLGTQVEQAEAQYQIALQLDTIRVDSSMVVDGDWREAQAEPRYEKVFREQLGLDLKSGALPQLGQRAKASPLRYVLAATLDHWADVSANWDLLPRLLEVARLADPDPWRNQVRDLKTWEHVPTMRHLADVVQPAQQTPQILVLLAKRLHFAGVRRLQSKSEALKQEAATLLQEGAALLRGALVHYPADFWLNWELGFRSRDLGEQIGSYRAALSVRPTSALTYNNLGWALHEKKDAAGAIAHYRKALTLDPKYAQAHYNLGMALYATKDVSGAIASFQKALELDPKLVQALNNLGNVLAEQGDLKGAMACYRKALELEPKDAKARNNLGLALYHQGDVKGAIACYKQALELEPKLAQAHNNLGTALQAQRDLKGAIQEFRKAIELDPKDPRYHNSLGAVLCDFKRDYDRAVACFEQALALAPQSSTYHFNLGNALVGKKVLDRAIREYHKAIEIDPKVAVFHLNLGHVLVAKKDLDGAIKAYKKTVELDRKNALYHYILGNALSARKDTKGALACFKKAVALAPDFAEAHCNVGHELRRLGQFAEALKELELGHKLGSAKPGWPYESAKWVKQCEALLALDQKLAAIQQGKAKPADVVEQLALADLCLISKQQYAAASEFYDAAFTKEPKLAGDVSKPHRYNAACAAALAAAGKGKDADKLDAPAKAKWRKQALAWLQADLQLWQQQAKNSQPAALLQLAKKMSHWQTDPDLAGVRDAKALAQLPEAERKRWQDLWADVAELLHKAEKKGQPE
jgi:serine/threonine-protein kinase